MALHEHFREYTAEDIKYILNNVCIKHDCPYLRALTGQTTNPRYPNTMYMNKCCMYIDVIGHSRGCMPDECTHYDDQIKSKKRRYKDEY